MRYILMILLFVNLSFAKDYGLIVILGKYQESKVFEHLRDANDNLKIILKISNKLGIKKSDLVLLRDEKATKTAILKNLRDIGRKFKKDDRFFMYFSGHGTSSEDKKIRNKIYSHQERDIRLIQNSGALVAYDSKVDFKNIVNSIIVGKRDLKPIFTKIDKLSSSALVILDSCYSKCATRDDHNKLCGTSTDVLTDKKNYPYKNLVSITSSSDESKVGYFAPVLDKCIKTSDYKLLNIAKCIKKNSSNQLPTLFPIQKSMIVF